MTKVKVIQADRDRAAEFLTTLGRLSVRDGDAVREGAWDETYDVQTFARHRLTHSSEEGRLREALEKAEAAINSAFMQADAENRCHDRIADRHDKIVREGRDAIRTALSGSTLMEGMGDE